MSRDDMRSRNGSDSEWSTDGELAQALDAYFSAVEAGRPVDPERLAAEHPAIADELRSCLEVLRLAGRVEGEDGVDAAIEVAERARNLVDPDAGRLPHPPPGRPRRHGGRLRGRTSLAAPTGRVEGASVRLGARPPAVAPVPDRGPGRGATPPHQHRARVLGRLRARRALLRRIWGGSVVHGVDGWPRWCGSRYGPKRPRFIDKSLRRESVAPAFRPRLHRRQHLPGFDDRPRDDVHTEFRSHGQS